MFSWKKISKPIVALAPMAGVTDAAYRQIIKSLATEAIVYSEFLSTDAIHYNAKKTIRMIHFDPELERPFIVQVFGKKPEHFVTACKIVEEMGADGIDINMGCPAARVVSSCHGSALMRNPELAVELVHAAVSAVSIPVSVKTRLGWENADNLIPFCKQLESVGASALAIHGRTYKQQYSGEANWEPIYALKKEVSIPVIGNGDIASGYDAKNKIGNLDGVMIGRGTMGNPWLLLDVWNALHEKHVPRYALRSSLRSALSLLGMTCFSEKQRLFQEKIPTIFKHCELAKKHKGDHGLIEMRKHFVKYVRGFDGAKEMRMKLMGATKMEEIEIILHTT